MTDGVVNEEEFLDLTKPIVHVTGNLGEDSIRPVEYNTLDGNYVAVLDRTIQELRETSGNTVLITGGSVNIREKASASGKVLGIAHKGDTFPYRDEIINNRWLGIIYKNKNAYVSNKYAKVILK